MSKQITVSPSPHVHSGQSVEKMMYGVVIAMLPALAVSIYFYGIDAIRVTLIATASCVLFEFLIQKYLLKTSSRITDGSAIVTGMLLAFNLPSDLPIPIIMVGALVSIGIGKLSFGGLGNNPFNPALVGRVFLLISFPKFMTTNFAFPNSEFYGQMSEKLDASTGATPLGLIKSGFDQGKPLSELMQDVPGHMEMFIGGLNGSLGEIAGAALVLGLIFMLVRKIITWHIPITVLGSFFIFSGILWVFSLEGHEIILESLGWNIPYISYLNAENIKVPFHMADPVFHLVSGGVLLGAIFMATDYVTSPMTHKGQIIYSIGIGLITVAIRVFGAYPEGISFAILIMNAFVPIINSYVKPKRFGLKN